MHNETISFQGYCKILNQTRDMNFVYEVDDGEYCLLHGDCNFESCRHSSECTVIRQAIAKEEE